MSSVQREGVGETKRGVSGRRKMISAGWLNRFEKKMNSF
jgi:hypothetical protein